MPRGSTVVSTIATLFSGGEGVGVGARMAGLQHIWGIEADDKIAQVARDNGFNVTTINILDVDPVGLESPTVLHASPPCLNFSVARQGREETSNDLALAQAVAHFIEVLQPPVFTLENVWGYRKSKGWDTIGSMLSQIGYWYDLAHVNAADFGVPQTRRRMIVRAIRGGLIPPFPPTEQCGGWYKAIEDLLPTLPESQLAPWQISWTTLTEICIVGGQYGDDGPRPAQTRSEGEPIFTVTSSNKGDWRVRLEDGHIVQVTPRALARFQSFPDSYRLPNNRVLACRIIGAAVPPLLYQKIVKPLIWGIESRHPACRLIS